MGMQEADISERCPVLGFLNQFVVESVYYLNNCLRVEYSLVVHPSQSKDFSLYVITTF